MAIIGPDKVFAPVSAAASTGEAMGRIRIWLDDKQIRPLTFRMSVRNGSIGFELTFRNEDETVLFDREFG